MSAVVEAVPWIGGSPITAAPWKPVWFGRLQVSGPDGEAVCTMWGSMGEGASKLQAIANAHLIAAAPELYEALDNIASSFPNDAPALIEARAALAKARGEQVQP